MKKIIFYPGPMHLFWTTGIYYLNELSKYFDVTLVLEGATEEDEEKINYVTENRLKKIYHIKHANKLRRHWIYRNAARKLVNEIKPDFVFADSDKPPFNVYLLREAKKNGGVNICYQTALMTPDITKTRIGLEASTAIELASNLNMPFDISRLLIRSGNYLRHYWYYYVAPIMIGCFPFVGPSSAFLTTGRVGMRDADYFIVFSQREKNICMLDGLPENKIVVIPHALTWNSNKDFKNRVLNYDKNKINNNIVEKNNITIFLDSLEHGISRETHRPIKKDEIYESWKRIIEILSKRYPDYSLIMKPHPATSSKNDFLRFLKIVCAKLPNVKFVEKHIDATLLMLRSKTIISESSTTLYTASLLFKDKIIISLDLTKRYFCDIYKDESNITYIDNFGDFENMNLRSRKEVELKKFSGRNLLFQFINSLESTV